MERGSCRSCCGVWQVWSAQLGLPPLRPYSVPSLPCSEALRCAFSRQDEEQQGLQSAAWELCREAGVPFAARVAKAHALSPALCACPSCIVPLPSSPALLDRPADKPAMLPYSQGSLQGTGA